MKTNGKRNKNAGHAFELYIVKQLIELGYPHVGTTRNLSRYRDSQKIDIMNKDEAVNGKLPYNIQTKSSTRSLAYPKILSEMPNDGDINVIFHRQTERAGSSGRFMTRGEFALMNLTDFYFLMDRVNTLDKILPYFELVFDYLEEDEKKEVNKILKK